MNHRILATGLVLFLVAPIHVQQWTRFRGPNGSGVSKAKSIPVRWTDNDYNWKVKLPGNGHSSPVLWGNRLFVTSGDNEKEQFYILCHDATTGRQLWSHNISIKPRRKHKLNSPASGTPAVDARCVYVCWGDTEQFAVTALDHDGKEVWTKRFEPIKSGHGDGHSPILHDDLVVISHCHQSALVALDCATGELRWRVAGALGHWSTPCVFQRDNAGTEIVFTNWKGGITAVDGTTGRSSWQADVFDKGHVESSISSPIVAGGLILGTSGWMGVRQEIIAVQPVAAGSKVKANKLYTIDRSVPLCVTPIVKEDLLFLWSDDGIVTCADLQTGTVHWRKRVGGNYYSSPICVGDNLYNISTEGEVVVVAASAVGFDERARNALGEPSHSTPAVANDTMYLRTLSHLMSIGCKR